MMSNVTSNPTLEHSGKNGRGPDRRRIPTLDRWFAIKLILMCLVNALGLFGVWLAALQHNWLIVSFLLLTLIVADIVYFSRKMQPAKYLLPGLFFLLVFQVFVIGYSGYAALTNYGDGHNSDKQDAIAAIQQDSLTPEKNSPDYPITLLSRGNKLYLLVTEPDGTAKVGTSGEPLKAAPGAGMAGGKAVSLSGYRSLDTVALFSHQKDILALQVPLSSDASQGMLQTKDGMTANLVKPTMVYDSAKDAFIETVTGDVYHATKLGRFTDSSGKSLEQGWKVFVGGANFMAVVTDPSLRGPFVGVLVWTFAFAAISVLLSYLLGLALAIVLNHPSVKGRKIYRALLILPYAFPSFLALLVWKGMFNTDYGLINDVLGMHIQWLTSPWLAKLSVIIVNVWMTFPYMFLVSTGAIQSLPDDLIEAAEIDGANWLQIFGRIKLPMLLVSTAPLLISSFATNFNNFNSIYMLTGGGPLNDPTAAAGSTDILISFVYRLAFGGVNKQYGLACAISMLIFVIVAAISIISFRGTKNMEEWN
jgi:arabinogalactan oligomer/maltooligosaccharide transport system permease protein